MTSLPALFWQQRFESSFSGQHDFSIAACNNTANEALQQKSLKVQLQYVGEGVDWNGLLTNNKEK